ncbi:MAG: hypothetical protein WC360_09565, partial [Opitutales bacterium]
MLVIWAWLRPWLFLESWLLLARVSLNFRIMNPALILLPGLDGTGRLFSDFVAALGPEADVVVVSYPTDQCLSYHELVAFVRPFLPRDRPYVILAESFSGPIGIALAASA